MCDALRIILVIGGHVDISYAEECIYEVGFVSFDGG